MTPVCLFAIDCDGFTKTVTAQFERGSLVVSSHASDTDGYNRDYQLRVAPADIATLADALELRRVTERRIVKALEQRFNFLAADAKLEQFLRDAQIPVDGGGYTRFP